MKSCQCGTGKTTNERMVRLTIPLFISFSITTKFYRQHTQKRQCASYAGFYKQIQQAWLPYSKCIKFVQHCCVAAVWSKKFLVYALKMFSPFSICIIHHIFHLIHHDFNLVILYIFGICLDFIKWCERRIQFLPVPHEKLIINPEVLYSTVQLPAQKFYEGILYTTSLTSSITFLQIELPTSTDSTLICISYDISQI